MTNQKKPSYDFTNPIFKKVIKYRRWAKEHLNLSEIDSDVIKWEVQETDTALQIPIKYHIHYKIKSIIGIDDTKNPIYSSYHIMELTLPSGYPMEPCKIYMLTPTWHPNIKSEGVHKGRICGNVKSFGKAYDLYQMVLRVGEILQYKNYHAQHIPPYPEDSTVAHWVANFAEPNGIVDKNKGIFIDETPLVRQRDNNEITGNEKLGTTKKVVLPKEEPLPKTEVKPKLPEVPKTPKPTPTLKTDSNKKTEPKEEDMIVTTPKLKLGSVRKNSSKIRLQIKKKSGDKGK